MIKNKACKGRVLRIAVRTMLLVLLAGSVILETVNLVMALPPQTITGFVYPTGLAPTKDINYGYDGAHSYYNYAGWLARGDKDWNNDGITDYESGLYHIGQDIEATVGDNVYAIADGEIVYVSTGGWNLNAGDNNFGLFVKHKLNTGEEFYALYGHVRPIRQDLMYSSSGHVNPPVKVNSGIPFATIGPYGSTPHLHFGIHPGLDIPQSNWGRMPVNQWPNINGFVDPIDWIKTRTPSTVFALSTDTAKPKVISMSVKYSSLYLAAKENVQVLYLVEDNIALKQIELWHKATGGQWEAVPGQTKKISGTRTRYKGSFKHQPSEVGTHSYGIHVVDKAGNWDSEGNAGPKEVVAKVLVPIELDPEDTDLGILERVLIAEVLNPDSKNWKGIEENLKDMKAVGSIIYNRYKGQGYPRSKLPKTFFNIITDPYQFDGFSAKDGKLVIRKNVANRIKIVVDKANTPLRNNPRRKHDDFFNLVQNAKMTAKEIVDGTIEDPFAEKGITLNMWTKNFRKKPPYDDSDKLGEAETNMFYK